VVKRFEVPFNEIEKNERLKGWIIGCTVARMEEEMKKKLLIGICFLYLLVPLAKGQTIEQCKSAIGDLMHVKTEQDFSVFFDALTKPMTSGDELTFSTNLARCLAQYEDQFSAEQVRRLNLLIYKLDADVILRMQNFLERHKLSDTYNNEEEHRRKK